MTCVCVCAAAAAVRAIVRNASIRDVCALSRTRSSVRTDRAISCAPALRCTRRARTPWRRARACIKEFRKHVRYASRNVCLNRSRSLAYTHHTRFAIGARLAIATVNGYHSDTRSELHRSIRRHFAVVVLMRVFLCVAFHNSAIRKFHPIVREVHATTRPSATNSQLSRL